MPPKPRFSAYGLLQASSDLLKTKISDLLLFVSVGALIYSLLKGVNFDLKYIFTTLQAETLTLISIGVYILLWLFAHASRLILWLTETRELAPAAASNSQSNRFTAPATATASQTEIDILTQLSSQAFPKGAFSDRDLLKKHTTYSRWFSLYPDFARLIRSQKGNKPAIGFCIVLPISQDSYRLYRNGEIDPWSWGAKDIVQSAKDIPMGEPLYLYFQAIYCPKLKTPKSESPFLTSVALEHIRSIKAAMGTKDVVIIAPRKSPAGQKGITALGFDGVRQSQAGFPLYELDTRHIQDRSKAAQAFAAVI